MIAINLSKKQALDADLTAKQIKLTRNLSQDGYTPMFFNVVFQCFSMFFALIQKESI